MSSEPTICHQATKVTAECPVEFTIYGYYPSLPINAFFCALFAGCLLAQLVLGIRHRAWTFLLALGLGCLAEAIGYVGRILLHANPYSSTGFEMQICCLIMAPAFLAAGVYLTLKHVVIAFDAGQSRFAPRWYTWGFIVCDLLSLVLKACGGEIAATSDQNASLQSTGNDLMMTGIVWQVITLVIFAALVGDFFWRVRRSGKPLNKATEELRNSGTFKLFLAAILLAFLTIFTRCVYRIAEMAGGWSNPIMQDETDFVVLDGVMCMVATLCMTVFHPGYGFPLLARSQREQMAGAQEKLDVESPPES